MYEIGYGRSAFGEDEHLLDDRDGSSFVDDETEVVEVEDHGVRLAFGLDGTAVVVPVGETTNTDLQGKDSDAA